MVYYYYVSISNFECLDNNVRHVYYVDVLVCCNDCDTFECLDNNVRHVYYVDVLVCCNDCDTFFQK